MCLKIQILILTFAGAGIDLILPLCSSRTTIKTLKKDA